MVARPVVGLLVLLVCLSFNVQGAGADVIVPPKSYDEIRFVVGSNVLYINRQATSMDASPFIAGDRAYVPVRYLLGAIGVPDDSITWDPASQAVKFPYRARVASGAPEYTIKIGDPGIYASGMELAGSMEAPPVMKDGRVFVPVRLVANFYRCNVSWNSAERSVTINAPVF